MILSWGGRPRDFDIHLLLCDRCEVFYANSNCPGANLDTDVVMGYGPETISIDGAQYLDTKYVLFVYQYSDAHIPWSSSGATMNIRCNFQKTIMYKKF